LVTKERRAERVVLNALAKKTRLCRLFLLGAMFPILVLRLRRMSFGIVFREADPPSLGAQNSRLFVVFDHVIGK
jgi:hypothetical protein